MRLLILLHHFPHQISIFLRYFNLDEKKRRQVDHLYRRSFNQEQLIRRS